MTQKRFAIRADSSVNIGSGHVMRCLTLANALRDAGCEAHFICRDLDGHISQRIVDEGFALHLLPRPESDLILRDSDVAHASWAGVTWEDDAAQTAAYLAPQAFDWIVLDHYAFDRRWSAALGSDAARRLVLDDLSDRPHMADILVDQTVGKQPDAYDGRVGATCRVFAGADYALLRPVFSALRAASLSRRAAGQTRRLLITLGGYDPQNLTSEILKTIAAEFPDRFDHIDVVLGANAPNQDKVRAQCVVMPSATQLHVNTPEMAQLMASADVAIGGAGVTAIERCVLGVPTVLFVLAENQNQQAGALSNLGAAQVVDVVNGPLGPGLRAALRAVFEPNRITEMSAACAKVTRGLGTQQVVAALLSD